MKKDDIFIQTQKNHAVNISGDSIRTGSSSTEDDVTI